MHSIKTLDLQEKLQDVGFYEIKMRNAGRYGRTASRSGVTAPPAEM